MSITKILDVPLANVSQEEILRRAENYLDGNISRQVVTLNPEILLKARKNEEYRNILQSSDLNVADGAGLHFALWVQGKKLHHRITGVNFMDHVLQKAQEKKLSVFLATRSGGLSTWKETRDALLKKFPSLKISGISIDMNDMDSVNASNWDIVLCNFGAPHQEYFLSRIKNNPNSQAKMLVGVGGAFDFYAGKIKRAPVWMRKIGLEWLWRLVQQPTRRLKRILGAVILFPLLVFYFKIRER